MAVTSDTARTERAVTEVLVSERNFSRAQRNMTASTPSAQITIKKVMSALTLLLTLQQEDGGRAVYHR
jgi:hypothetical protein